MNLHDLFERMHTERAKRRFQYLLGALIAGLLLLMGAWIDGTNHQAKAPRWVCFAERTDENPYVELVAYTYPDKEPHTKPGIKVACP